jgi:hypothetical protein
VLCGHPGHFRGFRGIPRHPRRKKPPRALTGGGFLVIIGPTPLNAPIALIGRLKASSRNLETGPSDLRTIAKAGDNTLFDPVVGRVANWRRSAGLATPSGVSFGSGNAKNPPIAWIDGFLALGYCSAMTSVIVRWSRKAQLCPGGTSRPAVALSTIRQGQWAGKPITASLGPVLAFCETGTNSTFIYLLHRGEMP